MSTRFYFPSTGTPSISPAFDASWETTTNADRRDMVTTRISSAMATLDGAGNSATTDQLLRQYISAALAAQTITGTIKGVVRCYSVTGNAGVGRLAVRVAKCASDGSGVTEIRAITFSSGTGTPPAMADGTLRSRRFAQTESDFSLELTDTAVSAGDRLIVEVGYKDDSSNTSRRVGCSFGDDSSTDLAEDQTTTTADNPWVEFSMDISFDGGAPAGQPTSRRHETIPFMGHGRRIGLVR